MSDVALPGPREFVVRARRLDWMVTIPSLGVIVTYLGLLLDLSSPEWKALLVAGAVYATAGGLVLELVKKRLVEPITTYLAQKESGEKPAPDVCRAAFKTAVVLPRDLMRMISLVWLLAPPALAAGISLLGFGSWGFDYRLLVLGVAGSIGAMLGSAFVFFGAKRMLTELRMALAGDIADPLERAALVHSTSLPRKLQVVVVGAVLATSMLIVTLAQSQASKALDANAVSWQQRILAGIETRIVRDNDLFEDVVLRIMPDADLLPYPASFFSIEIDELEEEDGLVAPIFSESIIAAIERGERSGHMIGGMAGGSVTWRRLSDGRLLLAELSESAAAGAFGIFHATLLLAVLLSAAAALGVAFLMSDDFRRSTSALVDEAERMAQGDLSRGQVWEAEDEMGGLGRAFERMGAALRATVGRVAEAADRVDAAAGEIASVSQGVAMASADQVRRIQQANELMVQIKVQVEDVSGSAQALNVSVEESSSSILELGAAGDELNDTASVLSSKVDEVSGSIEEMVRSVKQVSATTEGLSQAASETSSSMEEMASAMRAVDTTAEATASLSSEVVGFAESGRQKVSQTIEGMEEIRDATEAAERVILGLGARAKEIGGILDVIDDVADETNLLALNAAIIAAQAGEHGRAFSVVADEIKELADRVLSSTKEIGQLIRSVQEETDNAVGAITVGTQSVATGVERSAEAGTALEAINRASRESGSRIGEIVSAVREQTKATIHVVTLMEGVSDGVQQILTASSEQDRGNEVVYRSVVTMREVAQQVRRTTEEQSRGFGRIRENVEGVREAVENINGSLQHQSTACSQVATFLEQVFEGTRSNEEAAQRMGESMQALVAQAQTLRDDVAKFQV
ncbi:MAG: hypothetical protein JRG92_12865 [Deltaproteobacteria bacterium]|nr:hypothetical protein [Deltaproteobacteria bacterium]MBW2384522.1 hypothetical protein [Deltaproteobacteria bacterium]MBW2695339.1 hypothetical protein [Deltaproteobacteria bacterium]